MSRRNTTAAQNVTQRSATAIPPLLPGHAFVVQFRATADLAHGHWEGRVEHIVSSHAALFHSQEELLDFLSHVWTQLRCAEER